MELEQGDIVLCTVDRIVGTTVFVKIDSLSSNEDIEGTIITSEIAPGRIRNLRDYVIPKKKIVCKILRISGNQINLSLRRVTQKERKEILEEFKLEKSYESILRSVLGEKSKEIIEQIKSKDGLYRFMISAKENPRELEKIVGISEAQKIIEIIGEEKEKIVSAKKEISLTTNSADGLEKIKELFKDANKQGIEVRYISAGKYSLKKTSKELKKTDQEIKNYIEEIERFAKENHLNFAVK